MSNQPELRDYPTFPVNLSLFRALVECLAAIIASDLIHGTYSVHRETFLTIHLHQLNLQRLFTEGCCMEDFSMLHLMAACFQAKTVLELDALEIHQKIFEARLSGIEGHGEGKHTSPKSDHETLKAEMRGSKLEQ